MPSDLAKYSLVDQTVDSFETFATNTGVDAGTSTSEGYNYRWKILLWFSTQNITGSRTAYTFGAKTFRWFKTPGSMVYG